MVQLLMRLRIMLFFFTKYKYKASLGIFRQLQMENKIYKIKENLGVCLAVEPACLRMGIGQLGIRVTNGKLDNIVYHLVGFFFFYIHLVALFFFFIHLGVVMCVEEGRREVPRGHWSPCWAQIVNEFLWRSQICPRIF